MPNYVCAFSSTLSHYVPVMKVIGLLKQGVTTVSSLSTIKLKHKNTMLNVKQCNFLHLYIS